jgi:hypothetical protein
VVFGILALGVVDDLGRLAYAQRRGLVADLLTSVVPLI